jgi:hypothetical protein
MRMKKASAGWWTWEAIVAGFEWIERELCSQSKRKLPTLTKTILIGRRGVVNLSEWQKQGNRLFHNTE